MTLLNRWITYLIWLGLFGWIEPVHYLYSQSHDVDGFASVSAYGQDSTTGGAGGNVITVTNATDFLLAIEQEVPLTILVDGTIRLSDMHKVTSHKTILGVYDRGIISGGGFNLSGVSNIIIQNLFFTGSMDDAINIQSESHHIWINHCDFTAAHDGLLDIKRGSDYITVSWNCFTHHVKTCLLGHSNSNESQDRGKLRVTYHHNWFNGTETRHPRVRFSGLCHVYNNYYFNNIYGVASTMDAEVLVESNYFEKVDEPTHVGYASSAEGDLVERNNRYINCDNLPETKGEVPEPPYQFEPDNVDDIPAIVSEGAGRAGFDYHPISRVNTIQTIVPARSFLEQNFPNPFNPQTFINYRIARDDFVELDIYSTIGQRVCSLVNGFMAAGSYIVRWDGRNGDGKPVSSGIYYYQLKTGDRRHTRKLLLLR